MIAQKFFENTAGSQFIKNIVANFPLPIIPTTATGDYIIKNNYYVFANRIIKCTGSGIIGETGSYDVLQSSDFGRKYRQFTTTYMANEKYYRGTIGLKESRKYETETRTFNDYEPDDVYEK